MDLAPDVFWALTVREFWIKYGAFTRAEDRRRGLMVEHALLVGNFKPKDRAALSRMRNALRRYPVKKWLQDGSGTNKD